MTNYLGQLVAPGLKYGQSQWKETKLNNETRVFVPDNQHENHMIIWLYSDDEMVHYPANNGISHRYVDIGPKYASYEMPISLVRHKQFGSNQFNPLLVTCKLVFVSMVTSIVSILLAILANQFVFRTTLWIFPCIVSIALVTIPSSPVVQRIYNRYKSEFPLPIEPTSDQLDHIWKSIELVHKFDSLSKCLLVGTGYSADICAKILCKYDPPFVIRFLGIAGLYVTPESLIGIRKDIDVACLFGILGNSHESKAYVNLLAKTPQSDGSFRNNQWELGPAGFGNGNLLAWSNDTWFYIGEMVRIKRK